jgi:hypothetical protein
VLGEVGRDAVEDQPQAELEAVVAGPVLGVGDQPAEHRVPAGLDDLPHVRRDRFAPLLVGQAPAGTRLGLGQLGLHRAGHVRLHGVLEVADHGDVQPEPVHGAQGELHVPQGVGPERRPVGGQGQHPRVSLGGGAAVTGQRLDVAAPVAGRGQRLLLADDLVEQQVQQVLLAGHVAVERHRAGTQLGADAPHGELVQALGVGHLQRGLDHAAGGQRRLGRERAAVQLRPDQLGGGRYGLGGRQCDPPISNGVEYMVHDGLRCKPMRTLYKNGGMP